MTCAGNCSARSAMPPATAPPICHSVAARPARTPSAIGLDPPMARPVISNSSCPCAISASRRRVRKERPRLRKKAASRRLVLPEALGPVKRLAAGSSSSSTSVRQRKCSARKLPSGIRSLQSHRHHDVPRARGARRANQAARVAVGDADFHLIAIDRRQGIEQVADVEADFELIPLVRDLDLFLGLFLFRVVRLQRELILLEREPYPAVLLVRQDRRPLQRRPQYFPVRSDGPRRGA